MHVGAIPIIWFYDSNSKGHLERVEVKILQLWFNGINQRSHTQQKKKKKIHPIERPHVEIMRNSCILGRFARDRNWCISYLVFSFSADERKNGNYQNWKQV